MHWNILAVYIYMLNFLKVQKKWFPVYAKGAHSASSQGHIRYLWRYFYKFCKSLDSRRKVSCSSRQTYWVIQKSNNYIVWKFSHVLFSLNYSLPPWYHPGRYHHGVTLTRDCWEQASFLQLPENQVCFTNKHKAKKFFQVFS